MKKPASSSRAAPRPRRAGRGAASATVMAFPPAGSSAAEVPAITLAPVRFGYFDPDAGEVFLVGSFNDWDLRATPLRRDALGNWSVELELPPGKYRYRLMVDGEWRAHPSAPRSVRNPHGGVDGLIVI